ncbi:MAG TPA: hypothetical protein HA263_01945 [Methanoregulaceae archaeon]|nr:hypothetical protein [Methanoregulaceae archaeon]
MTAAGPHTLLDAPPVRVQVSALDETADLVEMLARVMQAGPPGAPGGIDMHLHASSTPPRVDGLFDGEGSPASWRSYCVRDRVLIRESPSRGEYLCGVPGYPVKYPSAQVRWHLASFITGGLLSLLSDRLLLVHGALIADGDAGHVLAGASGAGKSTAAARVPAPWRGVADDMLAAVATEDGYALLPLPTWSAFDADPEAVHAVETDRTFSLAGLWFLEPSPADAAAPLGPTAAVQRLAENALTLYSHYWGGFCLEDRVRLKRNVLVHATRIAGQSPCRVLRAARHGRFWEYLRAG